MQTEGNVINKANRQRGYLHYRDLNSHKIIKCLEATNRNWKVTPYHVHFNFDEEATKGVTVSHLDLNHPLFSFLKSW